jgi:hypothetical protein
MVPRQSAVLTNSTSGCGVAATWGGTGVLWGGQQVGVGVARRLQQRRRCAASGGGATQPAGLALQRGGIMAWLRHLLIPRLLLVFRGKKQHSLCCTKYTQ